MAALSDVAIITLLTLAVYYPITLGVLALCLFFAFRQRKSPYWRLALILLSVMFVLIALAAFNWYRYR
jgi:membrane-bound ClpP family serine protease